MKGRPFVFAVAIVLLIATLGVSAVSAAGRPSCLVTNTRAGLGSQSLQEAINAAAAGDTLVVSGTCVGTSTVDRSLTLRGVGTATLDGDGAGPVVWVTGGLLVAIGHLTITNGGETYLGGGLRNDGSALTLANVTIAGNDAFNGGGVGNAGGTMIVTNSNVVDNTSESSGGGIYNSGTLFLSNSHVQRNTSNAGGGILSVGDLYLGATVAYLTITRSTVSDNVAEVMGGGISNGASDAAVSVLMLDNSPVSDNTAGTYGGGIDNGGIGTITDSVIRGNHAGTGWWGGGISSSRSPYAGSGVLTVTRSTIEENTASFGGGIGNVSSPPGPGELTIVQSRLRDNAASGIGGAIFNETTVTFGDPTSMIGGNTAAGVAGGIVNAASGTVTGACPTFLGGNVRYLPANTPIDYDGFACPTP